MISHIYQQQKNSQPDAATASWLMPSEGKRGAHTDVMVITAHTEVTALMCPKQQLKEQM